jgi:DNA (cytosine-5)-methyltransferase 1
MSYLPLSNREQMDAIHAELEAGRNEVTALGACVFAGAFSLGMEQAGINVAGHLELPDLDLGSNVSRQRWPVANIPLKDGYLNRSTNGEDWLSFIDELKSAGNVPRIFYANPPCVAYAGPGKHEGSSDDRMCYTRYVAYEAAFRLQPDIWTWELVPAIFSKERSFLDAMAFRARSLGYRCYAFLTTSAIHGGYQDRRRFHFVASKYDLDWRGVYNNESADNLGSKTLGDALELVKNGGDLPNNKNTYFGAFRSIMPYCPPGSHLREVADELMHKHYRPRGAKWNGSSRPGFTHTRGRLDRPSPNILGGHTVIHPVEDRYLTPRECATIMGFPLDYEFSPKSKAYAEIGRGLCTHNAAFLGRVLADGIRRGVRTVPALTGEPSHRNSWMQAIDWRSRGERLSLKMSLKERQAWWAKRHPDIKMPLSESEAA